MNWDALDLSILGPAFLAGLLVLSTHVPLGQQVLARGIIFLDLAVAQIAGLGVIIAHNLDLGHHHYWVQAIALGSAIVGSILLYLSEKHFRDVQEAIIGCIFILAASGSILLLSTHPQGGEQLKDLLAGQILWLDYNQLIPVALIYALVLALWFGLRNRKQPLLFYILFAITVTTSVQLIGIYLVFASLIIPALAVRIAKHNKATLAFALGVAAYGFGLLISALFDLPSGVTIVWTLAAFAITLVALHKQRLFQALINRF